MSKKEVVVTGIALQSALGDLSSSWSRLLAGETGISQHQLFPALPLLPLALIDVIKAKPQNIGSITKQLVAAVIADADWITPLPDCAVVIGSSRAYQSQMENYASRGETLPILEFLPHQNAIAAAHHIGSRSTVLAPMAACSTGIWSIVQGAQLIASGRAQQALVGGVEAPISPLTIAGFQQLGVLARDGCFPFDRQRQGLVLGEGGAVFALEEQTSAIARGAKIYGRILGWGLTNDAYHPCAIDLGGAGTLDAIQKCLSASQLQVTDINYIHGHGTATQLNDQHEANIIQKLWPQSIPIGGSKGAIGHTLGASAAIGVAFGLKSLQSQVLPPTVGCLAPAFDLDIVQSVRPHSLQHILCWSFGFGGQNAVVAIGSV